METIKKVIQDYLEVEGLESYFKVYLVPDEEIIVLSGNDGYITTDATEVIFEGIQNILKKNGVEKMSNKLPKDEVILKTTKVYTKKVNEDTIGVVFRNEYNGTTMDCMPAIASLAVDLEMHQPEEDKARFRSDLLEFMNKMRCRQVIT